MVGNGLKFTKTGSITIEGTTELVKKEGGEEKAVKLSVRDTGVGIKKEDQSDLF